MAKKGICIGPEYIGAGRCNFCVWAPFVEKVEVHVLTPVERLVPMTRADNGIFQVTIENLGSDSLYFYRLNEKVERPDPASRFQPKGIHGPSQVTDPHFDWQEDPWSGLSLSEYIIYEIHVGTFSPEGNFEGIISHLADLKELGITAIELMPIAQFPGSRNWGYDGVFPFAIQNSYGRPENLKRLVNECHKANIAVILDVVYNHLGPEGNYFRDFGPYFNARCATPWGQALNFDGPGSDEVRHFFIYNALYWLEEFHFDALRLDAPVAIIDNSARPFLRELASAIHGLGEQLDRCIYLIAEGCGNDPKIVKDPEIGGYGHDAVWNGDFHHSLHVLLTKECEGNYKDFVGLPSLAKAYDEGFVLTGQYSFYRQRHYGASSKEIDAAKLVVFAQNHDQIGNRMLGERISRLVSFEKLKLSAGAVLLSPFIPLLFMGEEYGELAPFAYFISHSDPELVEAVRRGRRREFSAHGWKGETPDPQDEATFLSCKLDRHLRAKAQNNLLYQFYKEVIRIRKELPPLSRLNKESMEVAADASQGIMTIRRWANEREVLVILNFGDSQTSVTIPVPNGSWFKLLDSTDQKWLSCGSPVPAVIHTGKDAKFLINSQSFVVFVKQEDSCTDVKLAK
jgi:maltooligosyltrehalose trehalohydrolase